MNSRFPVFAFIALVTHITLDRIRSIQLTASTGLLTLYLEILQYQQAWNARIATFSSRSESVITLILFFELTFLCSPVVEPGVSEALGDGLSGIDLEAWNSRSLLSGEP
jgi:hypothetical protein